MADVPGSPDDVKVITPPSRQTGLDALAEYQTEAYQATSLSQKLQKQHRTFAAGFATMELPSAVAALGITAAAAYNQAQIQSIIDKLDAVIAQQAAILTLLQFQKELSASNIVKPT